MAVGNKTSLVKRYDRQPRMGTKGALQHREHPHWKHVHEMPVLDNGLCWLEKTQKQ